MSDHDAMNALIRGGSTASGPISDLAAPRVPQGPPPVPPTRDDVARQAVATALADTARAARAHDPDTVSTLLASRVVLGSNGQPTNVAALVDEARRAQPFLFRRTRSADAGAGAGAQPVGSEVDMGRVLRDAVRGRRG